jgi:hypothetical protein
MKRLGVVSVVVALSLGIAAQATAKEVVSAKVCGATDCSEIDDRASLIALSEGGPPTSAPEKHFDWYTAELVVRAESERETFPITLVPGAGLIGAQDGSWLPVSAQAVRAFEEMTRGLEPFPAATLEGVVPPEPAPEIAPPDDGSSLGWIAGAAGVLAVGLLVLVGVRRRRAGGTPRPAEG